MTDIEKKALDLINTVLVERGGEKSLHIFRKTLSSNEALCRAIEQHEAFRKEVSDAVELSIGRSGHDGLRAGHINEYLGRFIIAQPDPLVEAMKDLSWDEETAAEEWANDLRAALEARGLTITTLEKD